MAQGRVIRMDGDRGPKGAKGRPAPGSVTGSAAVAAGAQRATGERARRRRTTPLLAERESRGTAPVDGDHLPNPTGIDGTGPDREDAADSHADGANLRAAGPDTAPAGEAHGAGTHSATLGGSGRPEVHDRLAAVVAAAQEAGAALADALGSGGGGGSGEVDERVAAVLAFLRRRLTGEFEVDDFGFDPELTDSVLLALLRPLYRSWFRVEVRGIENIPDTGGALIVANHSGAVAFDALMTQVAVHDEHPSRRHLRLLGADLVFQLPFLGELARKGGATLAANADAERLLGAGEVVGVWPEGFKGIGKPFSERYKLQRFGRGGFVSAALRTRTPIVPCAIVGAEETYPILGNMPTLARLLGVPYLPVTPTFPLLGPLGLVPLPSKWLIEFGAPVPTDELGLGAADDPMLVFDLTDQIRQTIQQTLYSLLVQRRSVFF